MVEKIKIEENMMIHLSNTSHKPLCGEDAGEMVTILSMATCPACRHEQMWLNATPQLIPFARPRPMLPNVAISNNGKRRTDTHTASYDVLARGDYSEWFSTKPAEAERYIALRCILVDNTRGKKQLGAKTRKHLLAIACGKPKMTYNRRRWLQHISLKNQIGQKKWDSWQDFISRLLANLNPNLPLDALLELVEQIVIKDTVDDKEVILNGCLLQGSVARRLLDSLYTIFGFTPMTAMISTAFSVTETAAVAVLEEVGEYTCRYSFRYGSEEFAVKTLGKKLLEQAFGESPLYFFIEPLSDEVQS